MQLLFADAAEASATGGADRSPTRSAFCSASRCRAPTSSTPASGAIGCYAAMRKLQARLAEGRTLVVVVEDMHWADSQSFEILTALVRDPLDRPVLGVATARHDERMDRAGAARTRSPPSSSVSWALREREELVRGRFADAGRRARAGMREILDRAGGNPFYINEIIESLVERGILQPTRATRRSGCAGCAATKRCSVPTTVEAVVASRLDRLPDDERDTIRRAALLGRIFRVEDLQALTGGSTPETLSRALVRLVGARAHRAGVGARATSTAAAPAPTASATSSPRRSPTRGCRRTRARCSTRSPPIACARSAGVSQRRRRRAPGRAPGRLGRPAGRRPRARLGRHLRARQRQQRRRLRAVHARARAPAADAHQRALRRARRARADPARLGQAPGAAARGAPHAQARRGDRRRRRARRREARGVLPPGPALPRRRQARRRAPRARPRARAGATAPRTSLVRVGGAAPVGDAAHEHRQERRGARAGASARSRVIGAERRPDRGATSCSRARRRSTPSATCTCTPAICATRCRPTPRRWSSTAGSACAACEAATLNNMGWVFVGLGEYEEALGPLQALAHGWRRSSAIAPASASSWPTSGRPTPTSATSSARAATSTRRSRSTRRSAISRAWPTRSSRWRRCRCARASRPRPTRSSSAASSWRRRRATATRRFARSSISRSAGSTAAARPAARFELAQSATRLAREAEIANGEVYGLCAEALALARAERHQEALARSTQAVALFESGRDVDSPEEVLLHPRARRPRRRRRVGRARGAAARARRGAAQGAPPARRGVARPLPRRRRPRATSSREAQKAGRRRRRPERRLRNTGARNPRPTSRFNGA